MPPDYRERPDKEDAVTHDYDADKEWRRKPITPAQVLVHDIRLESLTANRGPQLEVVERSSSTLVPETAAFTPHASLRRAAESAANPIEQRRFASHEENFGWLHHLRLGQHQRHVNDPEHSAKCRWIHCSSLYPEYLSGFFYALSEDRDAVSGSLRLLEHAIQRHQRFSKHGKHFTPFSAPLSQSTDGGSAYPFLIACPWLDWSVQGRTPPLRFQIDRREGFQSARYSSHMLRSILQYYFRLEDTRDRDRSQVFSKHTPWTTDREIDLKIRQWYGHRPNALNVDELWILAIDAEHIVTFSSNQTWKSRFPPLQLTSRISDVSFRAYRRTLNRANTDRRLECDAAAFAVTCLSGAVGMMHRSFWPDLPLCLTDRYAGHLGHLQYRLHRSPNTKLVMDLVVCLEELNIVIQITQQQMAMITELKLLFEQSPQVTDHTTSFRHSYRPYSSCGLSATSADVSPQRHEWHMTTRSPDPLAELLDNLQRELIDLQDLRDNANSLVNRTIQLVNIRLEDHGKAILVFTVVTIIFLPLNFVSSYFGMNFSDIRDLAATQSLFWAIAVAVTAGVLILAIFLAFQGGDLLERFRIWRDIRRERSAAAT